MRGKSERERRKGESERKEKKEKRNKVRSNESNESEKKEKYPLLKSCWRKERRSLLYYSLCLPLSRFLFLIRLPCCFDSGGKVNVLLIKKATGGEKTLGKKDKDDAF